MTCDELKLFLYADGLCADEERTELEKHLSRCKRCKTKLDLMQFAIGCFTSYSREVGRSACPSPDELVMFQEAGAGDERSTEMKAHINECPLCREELLILETCDEYDHAAASGVDSSLPLSPEVLQHVGKFKQRNLRRRMEHVVKTLLNMGRNVLTPETVEDILDRYCSLYPETQPMHAFPETMAHFGTELTLHEAAFNEITVNMGNTTVNLRFQDSELTVRINREGIGVSNVEAVVTTKEYGERTAVTGRDGIAVIEGIQPGPCQVSIRFPDDHT